MRLLIPLFVLSVCWLTHADAISADTFIVACGLALAAWPRKD